MYENEAIEVRQFERELESIYKIIHTLEEKINPILLFKDDRVAKEGDIRTPKSQVMNSLENLRVTLEAILIRVNI